MSIQNSAAIETGLDFHIPAPRTASPHIHTPKVHLVEKPVEVAAPVETVAATEAPTARPAPVSFSLAVLGVVLLLCGCAAAASFVVVAGPVLPLVAVIGILFGLFVIGQAVGRRPASSETYDIR